MEFLREIAYRFREFLHLTDNIKKAEELTRLREQSLMRRKPHYTPQDLENSGVPRIKANIADYQKKRKALIKGNDSKTTIEVGGQVMEITSVVYRKARKTRSDKGIKRGRREYSTEDIKADITEVRNDLREISRNMGRSKVARSMKRDAQGRFLKRK